LPLQVSHTTVRKCLRKTERKTCMRSEPVTDILEACLRSMVENDMLITLEKSNRTMVATTGVSGTQQLVRVVLNTQGYSRKKVEFHAPPSSTDIATTELLGRLDRWEAQARRSVYLVGETPFGRNGRIVYGYSHRRRQLYIRSNSKRKISSSVLAAVDIFGGLGFSRREGS
jgi:hypothetical protein